MRGTYRAPLTDVEHAQQPGGAWEVSPDRPVGYSSGVRRRTGPGHRPTQTVRRMSEPGPSREGTTPDLDDAHRHAHHTDYGDAEAARSRRTRAAIDVLREWLLVGETSG